MSMKRTIITIAIVVFFGAAKAQKNVHYLFFL